MLPTVEPYGPRLNMIDVEPLCIPKLDTVFVPAKLWNDRYQQLAREHSDSRRVRIQVSRPDGDAWAHDTRLLPDEPRYGPINLRYLERLLKFLIWAWGGNRVAIQGAPELVKSLQQRYASDGERAFDYEFMGKTCFLAPFIIEAADNLPKPASDTFQSAAKRELAGCRIGFDLGGSDRKCAALIDGEVVFSEEVKWDPYFQSDPEYHLAGIQDSLERAARHLPRVDAIGGSAAGVYVQNEPRVASLFRGVSKTDFQRTIRPIFQRLQEQWPDAPFVVQNDGDVTALAGSISMGVNGILGVSMGTSLAVGYINQAGAITGWLNELAFAPVDYSPEAPADEWSGDAGCGVQYFSQQAVGRLAPVAGLELSADLTLPEKLEAVQEKMNQGDERAAAIYESIGVCFGYSIAHFADFYSFEHLLFLGRVSSGEGGAVILQSAQEVLKKEFPALAEQIDLRTPDEKMKRHGQAVAAASLPVLKTKASS